MRWTSTRSSATSGCAAASRRSSARTGEGVLHLDIRPANVMAEAGIAKLIDLSLAGVPGPARPGRGTRHYMAPEQALGGTLSAATDVWGIGATLYEAATGEP